VLPSLAVKAKPTSTLNLFQKISSEDRLRWGYERPPCRNHEKGCAHPAESGFLRLCAGISTSIRSIACQTSASISTRWPHNKIFGESLRSHPQPYPQLRRASLTRLLLSVRIGVYAHFKRVQPGPASRTNESPMMLSDKFVNDLAVGAAKPQAFCVFGWAVGDSNSRPAD
jgi:hypothetical protein